MGAVYHTVPWANGISFEILQAEEDKALLGSERSAVIQKVISGSLSY